MSPENDHLQYQKFLEEFKLVKWSLAQHQLSIEEIKKDVSYNKYALNTLQHTINGNTNIFPSNFNQSAQIREGTITKAYSLGETKDEEKADTIEHIPLQEQLHNNEAKAYCPLEMILDVDVTSPGLEISTEGRDNGAVSNGLGETKGAHMTITNFSHIFSDIFMSIWVIV